MLLKFLKCALCTCMLGSAAVHAQDYPARPIRLLVGFPAGGGGDLMARVVGDQLSKKLDNPVVVVNMPGASATIATGHVAKAPPDGYTLLFTTSPFTLSASLFQTIPYDPIGDFAPIVRVAEGPYCLLVASSSPIGSVKDLIATAKAKPGTLNYGSGGNGSVSFFAVEMLKTKAGIDLQHVPFTGLPAAIAAVIGGQVQLTLPDLPSAISHVRSGRLKMIGVTSGKRVPSLPDVPTIAEAGVPGYEAALWYGLLAPRAVPRAVVQKLHGTITTIFSSPDKALAERLNNLGVVATAPHSPDDFAAFLKDDLAFWKQLVEQSGVKPK